MQLIDVHSHHYPDVYLEACRREDSGLTHYVRDDDRLVVLQDGGVALAAPQPLPDIDHRIGMMDRAGVAMQFVSVSAPNVYRFPDSWRASVTRDVNDELLEYVGRRPDRLRALVSLPLPVVDDALDELDRLADHPLAVGVFITSTVDGHTLDDPRFNPLWEDLSRRGIPTLVHPGVACCTDGLQDFALTLALDFMAETTNAIGRLLYSGTFEQFPDMKWIFTHLGGTAPFVHHRFDNYFHQFPECREHLSRPPSEILSRVYYDTVTTHAPALRCALETFGPEQLLFGTDYPHVPGGLERFVETLDAAGLDEDDRSLIAWKTASRLFSLETAESSGS